MKKIINKGLSILCVVVFAAVVSGCTSSGANYGSTSFSPTSSTSGTSMGAPSGSDFHTSDGDFFFE